MTSARETAEVISRGCRSRPKAIWIWLKWKFAIDASASMALGEEVAIGMLRDERTTLREPFDGFSFTRFDGSRATI